VDENGNTIVADWGSNRIRRVDTDGAVTPPVLLNRSFPPLPPSTFVSDIQRHLLESGSFYDVCFVVEQERVPAHRWNLSARCEYFRSMFSAGFQEGNSADINIKGTFSAAFRALLTYLYRDNMEMIMRCSLI
jgi:hypothetical protein